MTAPAAKRSSKKVPTIGFSHGGHDAEDFAEINRFIESVRKAACIYMIRDPRDVFVSYYYQRTMRNIKADVTDIDWSSVSMDELLRNERFGIHRIVSYMNAWFTAKDSFNRLHVLQYERVKQNAEYEFRRLIEFLRVGPVNEVALAEAVKATSFETMQRNERENRHSQNELRAMVSGDANSFKVRRGVVGGYKDELSAEQMEYCAAVMENLHSGLRASYGTV